MSVAARTPRSAPAASAEDFELQHATLTLMALVVKTGDPVRLLHALEARYGAEPPFDLDPVYWRERLSHVLPLHQACRSRTPESNRHDKIPK